MSDNNFLVYGDCDGQTLSDQVLAPPAPLSFSDTLKLSHASNFLAERCDITGGNEDCIDINRMCRDITVQDCILRIGGHQAVTIKGGSSAIHLKNLVIHGAGKYAEIELGNWSDQSMDKTTNVVIENCSRVDGRPLRIVVGKADNPIIIGGNCVINRKWSMLVKLYCWLKGLGLPI